MKNKLIRFTFVVLLLFLSVNVVSADFDKAKWIYSKEIRMTPFNTAKLASLVLDSDVFDTSRGGLSDLRIIDSAGGEVPYKLAVESSVSSRDSFPVKMTNLGSKPGEYTQLTLDLGVSGENHNSLTLQTSSINFRRQVEVEASSDSQNWFVIKKAAEGGYIYDYSVDFKAQNTQVYYPETNYRFLRVKIVDSGEVPIKISGAMVYRFVQQGSREVFYTPKVVDKAQDKEKRTSSYILDLESKGIPSNKLTFRTSDENYNRQVVIEGSNDRGNWVQVSGQDVIFNYNTPKFVGAKNSLNFTESNWRYLRITINNRDNAPINLSDFRVSGILRKILFQAQPEKQYRLYYGNADARFAEYDLESFIQYLDTTNTVNGVLGPQEKNADFKGPIVPEKPLTERFPYLLAGVLGVAVLILGTMVFKLAYQVKKGR